jgi:hypothetical protein
MIHPRRMVLVRVKTIGVALEHLLDRGGFITKDAVTGVHRAKNLIHGGR